MLDWIARLASEIGSFGFYGITALGLLGAGLMLAVTLLKARSWAPLIVVVLTLGFGAFTYHLGMEKVRTAEALLTGDAKRAIREIGAAEASRALHYAGGWAAVQGVLFALSQLVSRRP